METRAVPDIKIRLWLFNALWNLDVMAGATEAMLSLKVISSKAVN